MKIGSLDSLQTPVELPEIGSRVRIAGEPGLYLVAGVDRRRYVVNLVPADDTSLHVGIHISALSTVHTVHPWQLFRRDLRLIEEILGSKQE